MRFWLLTNRRLFSSTTMSTIPDSAIKTDRYRCATVDLAKTSPNDAALHESNFQSWLKNAESEWQTQKIRGIWFKIPLTHSQTVPILAKNEYKFHHTKPDCVAMVKWISPDEPDNIPPYAFTNVGVGGLVIDSRDRVLVIQEKYAVRGTKWWKFPGGVSVQGEEIGETAEREVFEETGVNCKFSAILTVRHLHKYQFGCSDFYIVCLMTVDESDPNALKLDRCEHEIDAVQWMPLEEALTQLSDFNQFVVKKYLLSKQTGFYISDEDVSFILGGKLKVYSINKKEDKSDS